MGYGAPAGSASTYVGPPSSASAGVRAIGPASVAAPVADPAAQPLAEPIASAAAKVTPCASRAHVAATVEPVRPRRMDEALSTAPRGEVRRMATAWRPADRDARECRVVGPG